MTVRSPAAIRGRLRPNPLGGKGHPYCPPPSKTSPRARRTLRGRNAAVWGLAAGSAGRRSGRADSCRPGSYCCPRRSSLCRWGRASAVDLSSARLAVFVGPFAPEAERHSGRSDQVSLIGGVDEHPSAVTLRAPRRTVEDADLADTVAALDDVARVSVELPEGPDRDLPETRLGEHSGKDVADAFGAEHLSQRGDGPARCEDVVVESLVVLAVVPAFCRREFQNVLRRIIWKSHLILAGALSRIIRATRIPICRKSVEMVVSPLRMISLIGDSL